MVVVVVLDSPGARVFTLVVLSVLVAGSFTTVVLFSAGGFTVVSFFSQAANKAIPATRQMYFFILVIGSPILGSFLNRSKARFWP